MYSYFFLLNIILLKSRRGKYRGKNNLSLRPSSLEQIPLLESFLTGYNAILVVCDCFSKMAHFIATTEKMSAEGLAKLF